MQAYNSRKILKPSVDIFHYRCENRPLRPPRGTHQSRQQARDKGGEYCSLTANSALNSSSLFPVPEAVPRRVLSLSLSLCFQRPLHGEQCIPIHVSPGSCTADIVLVVPLNNANDPGWTPLNKRSLMKNRHVTVNPRRVHFAAW